MTNRIQVGTKVYGDYGAYFPRFEGVVTDIIREVATIKWELGDYKEHENQDITFVELDQIHEPGWRSKNGSPIGVFRLVEVSA